MLTEFFHMNMHDPEAKRLRLLHKDFPVYFVWESKFKFWKLRKILVVVGRLVTVHPTEGERYYLTLLLSHVSCPTSFEDLRTVDGDLCGTFREAAMRRGLLESDDDLVRCLEEAVGFEMPYSLRRLFATILLYNSPSNPRSLWEKFEIDLSQDFARDRSMTVSEIRRKTIVAIDDFLCSMSRSVNEFHLIDTQICLSADEIFSKDYEYERSIGVSDEDLLAVHKLNDDQKSAFDLIIQSTKSVDGGAFFLDGPGGSGKTFLYRALLAEIRSKDDIALPVASSGVAASLLPGGRTAHSRFKLPLDFNQAKDTKIHKQTVSARLIKCSKLIIWDEATMANRLAVESLDSMLHDIMDCEDKIFGGKTVVFGGDFRQTLPIVVGGSKHDAIDASLISSPLWLSIQKLQLRENMRARRDPSFTEFLLRVGNGAEPHIHQDNIKIPSSMLLPFFEPDISLANLVDEVFPSFEELSDGVGSFFLDRALLAPKNSCVHEINCTLIDRFPGKAVEYVSYDLTNDPSHQAEYGHFINSVESAGLPPHKLTLKVNCPVMLLRNINPSEGLCNGTRLLCKTLGKRVIGAEIASGDFKGKYVMIPRIPLEPSDKMKCPITFKRHQFPIRLCFAMTINKAQGQTLDFVGIYLQEPVFSHGQLYVALSRARLGSSVRVLIRPPSADATNITYTRNIVYREVLASAFDE